MHFDDDTPEPLGLPDIYPAGPPRNLLPPEVLTPTNVYAFEGIDACGKSSIVSSVAEYFRGSGRNVHVRKVGGSDVIRHAMERIKWINGDPVCFSLLNWVSLYEQTGALRNEYNTGAIILLDRYIWTVKIRGRLEGLSPSFVDHLSAGLPMPTTTFLIDCPIDVSLERIRQSGRRISYFEAGLRDVDGVRKPMVEVDESARTTNIDRNTAARRHFARMRDMYLEYATSNPTFRVVHNSQSLADAVKGVIDAIEADLR